MGHHKTATWRHGQWCNTTAPGCSVWVTAVVDSSSHRFFRIFRHINLTVSVSALLVRVKNSVPDDGSPNKLFFEYILRWSTRANARIGDKSNQKYFIGSWLTIAIWHITILPPGGFVGGITPRSISVSWVTAVVTSSGQRFFRKLRHVSASMSVWALTVPTLAGLPGVCECACTGIFFAHFRTFAANRTCRGRYSLSSDKSPLRKSGHRPGRRQACQAHILL